MRTYVLSSPDAGRVPRGAVQGRAQPRQGHAVRLVAQPVHGLRAPLHVLLRPRLRAARRPAVGRPLRHVDPRQGRTSRTCCGASCTRTWPRETASRSAPPPTRTSRPKGATGSRARASRCSRDGGEPVLADHARAADRARRRRARRGGAARRRVGHVLGADARRRRLADDRAGHGAAAPAAAGAARARRRRRPRRRSGWRRSCPASPTARSSSRRSCARRARPGACGVWANLLHLKPGTREHFLDGLARDWPELLPEYERLYAAAPTSAAPRRSRDSARCGELARAHGIRDRRPVRLAPPPSPSS